MESLPFELMSGITENLNLRDAKNMYLSLTNDKFFINKESNDSTEGHIAALNERIDPRLFLKKLTSYPQELLDLMESYKCILTGECVLPFFFPNLDMSTNRWRIICPNNKGQGFIKKSKDIGMLWRITERSIQFLHTSYDLPFQTKGYIGFSRNFYGHYTTVELVDSYTESPLYILSALPTTLTPCFISGSIACHIKYFEIERNEILIRTKKLLEKDRNKIFGIDRSCKSCGLITNTRNYRVQSMLFNKLLAIRYTIIIGNHSREFSRDMILQALASNPAYIVHTTYDFTDIEEIADAFVADCTCSYKDGTELITKYKNMGLKLKEYDEDEIERRKINNVDSYIFKFREINDTRLVYLYNKKVLL